MLSFLRKTAVAAVEKTTGVSTSEIATEVSGAVENLRSLKSLPLKVKIRNLAAESRIIREEEERVLGYANALKGKETVHDVSYASFRSGHLRDFHSLKDHRETVVREEQRDTLLAYGFLRGLAFSDMEKTRYSDPNWDNIQRMILKYGRNVGSFKTNAIREQALKQSFAQWIDEAGPVAVHGPRKPRIRKSNR